MDLLIVKANADCFKKYLQGLTADAEELLRSSLRILHDPSGCGITDIQTGSHLKAMFGDKKNSHAISWFLGNDALFCLEECKTCNNTFGRTIENALSSYYQYYRAAEHRKSRNGKPLTAKGFNYEHLADGGLRYYATGPADNAPKVGERLPEEGLLIQLNNKEPVVLHDIYRVLVKYVVACLPNELKIIINHVKIEGDENTILKPLQTDK